MNSATIQLIMQGIAAAISAAPQVIAVANKAREFVAELFSARVITIEQQNKMMAHIGEMQAAALAGAKPPHWEVEPDPVP